MRKHPNSHREAKATAPVLDSTPDIAQNIHSLERDGALSRKYELHIHREIFSRMCTQTMKPERCLFNYRRRYETGMCCAFLTEACR